ncbi:MAG: choloylglycine hydrolase [Clostridia bacterium]|nr:choloylglycine hydrolase [Clostridia bacterium]
MCTALTYVTDCGYFGRNLDLERSYGEQVVVTPRRFAYPLRCAPPMREHYAYIGMATVARGVPLYYEATNEKGLSMAGLNFPDNAVYYPYAEGKDNICSFELIPWMLERCASVEEALTALGRLNVVDIPFSDALPLTPLHWLVADRHRAVTVECVKEGLQVYENPLGVLTNNPPFPYHRTNVRNYMSLHEGTPAASQWGDSPLTAYSLGMGAMGLPGDFSSASRFVRAAFVKSHSHCGTGEAESVAQFFHILASVAMPKGCVLVREGVYEYTRYSCCCNVDRGVYYYTTYESSTVQAVDMYAEGLEGDSLRMYPLKIQ